MKLGGPFMPIAFNRYSISPPGPAGGINFWGASYDPKLASVRFEHDQPLPADAPDPAAGRQLHQYRSARRHCAGSAMPTGSCRADRRRGANSSRSTWTPATSSYRKTLGALRHAAARHAGHRTPRARAARRSRPAASRSSAARTISGFHAFATATGESSLKSSCLRLSKRRQSLTWGSDGRQYVTIISTGGGLTGSEVTNDEVIAFALPK